MRKNNKKGFTIVELVIVIAVIAILAGVLIPTFASVVSKANESKALQEAKNAYTEDLAMLDGQVKANVEKGHILGYTKTKDTAVVTGKNYYTYDTTAKTYNPVSTPDVANIGDYFEATYVFAGKFDVVGNSDDYTYTYKADGSDYTCVYSTSTNKWTVSK
mgnify:CR=1 FL=1